MMGIKPGLSSSGIGLLEVVMASAIIGVILMALSTTMISGQKGAESVQKRLSATELQSFISQTLTNPLVCAQSGLVGQNVPVAGASVPTLTFASVKMDDGANNLFENGQIKISSLKYKTVTPSGNLYTVDVQLQINVQGATSQTVVGGSLLAPVDFPLVLTIVGGKIATCGGAAVTHLQTVKILPSCTTPTGSYNSCTQVVSWPASFADNSYSVTCTGSIPIRVGNPNPCPANFYVTGKTPTNFSLVVQTGCASAVYMDEVDCQGSE